MADVRGASEFGKDFGLIHEAIVTGRKVGADRELWARLAHDEMFFARVVSMHRGEGGSGELPNIHWEQVYAALGMDYAQVGELDTSAVDGLWTIPVLQGVTANTLVKTLREIGTKVYTYAEDLDANVPKNTRDPKHGSYVARFKKTIEADPEFANLSASDCERRKINGITLIERLLLEVGYFVATGSHLDIKNWTLCAGSRFSDGCVPFVLWRPDNRAVCVFWSHPDDRSDGMRVRAAV
jgi:hypothetical protein